jgi:hypothetical protein
MPETINTKDAALREIATLYLRVQKSEAEQVHAVVLAVVRRGLAALEGIRQCQRDGCDNPARRQGKFCCDRCANAARMVRYRQKQGATDSVTVEKFETLKWL